MAYQPQTLAQLLMQKQKMDLFNSLTNNQYPLYQQGDPRAQPGYVGPQDKYINQPPQPAQSLLSPFQQRRQERQTRRADRRQQRGLMQPPVNTQQQAQAQQQAQTQAAPGASKANKAAIIMGALSNIFAGRDPVQGTAAMQQQMMAMQDREMQLAEIESKKAQYEVLMKDQNLPEEQRQLLKSLGWQNMDAFLMKKFELDNRTPKERRTANIDGVLRYIDTGEQVFAGDRPESRSSSDPLRTISKDGIDIGAIRDSELTEEKIDELYGKGFVIQPLGRTSEAKGRPSEFGGWSDEGGLQTKYLATNALVRTGDRLLQNLYDNPTTVLTVGDLAQAFERAQQEVGALGGRPLDYNKHLNNSQLSKIADLAEGSAATESMLLDFTFQIAAARGQEGRGLSDKDFIIFQKIISAGLTANQKAAALTSFIEGIQEDVTGALDDAYKIHEIVLGRDPSNKESLFFKQGIEDLRKVGMLSVTNPFSRTKDTENTEDPLGIRQ